MQRPADLNDCVAVLARYRRADAEADDIVHDRQHGGTTKKNLPFAHVALRSCPGEKLFVEISYGNLHPQQDVSIASGGHMMPMQPVSVTERSAMAKTFIMLLGLLSWRPGGD